jgi:hypothetical protein
MLVQHGIDASCYDRFSASGIAQGRSRASNHSVYGAGLDFVDGEWVIADVNSWRPEFGPFSAGWCYVTERQIAAVIDDDAVGHIVTLDPVSSPGVPAPH